MKETRVPPSPPNAPDDIPLVVNGQRLSDEAMRALREARQRAAAKSAQCLPRELGGADRTTEPTRYNDWEKAGRAVDFS